MTDIFDDPTIDDGYIPLLEQFRQSPTLTLKQSTIQQQQLPVGAQDMAGASDTTGRTVKLNMHKSTPGRIS